MTETAMRQQPIGGAATDRLDDIKLIPPGFAAAEAQAVAGGQLDVACCSIAAVKHGAKAITGVPG